MDLLKLSKKAAKDPFHIKNFFVLFVTTFIALIVGLSLLSTLGVLVRGVSNKASCDFRESKKVSGKVSSTSNEVYQVDFKGNKTCFLSAAFTWESPTDEATVWVYNPDGKIEIVEPSASKTLAEYSVASPLKLGLWRFVIKGKNAAAFQYSGEISVN